MSKQSQIKERVKEQYGKIALTGDSGSCCSPTTNCCGTNDNNESSASGIDISKTVGYNPKELESIPQSSVLGLGCGNPTAFAHIKTGDTVVDLGSGAGIDVFLAANIVKDKGRVIGIDMTDSMLDKARQNAKQYEYNNVEFRKGDIETRIPIDDNYADIVISNCVINLTENKLDAFREIYRTLKPRKQGKMVISDLVTSKEIDRDPINISNWCSCIDGALTKDNYLDTIRQAGFVDIEILDEKLYSEVEDEDNNNTDNRKVTSITIKAFKS
jgi:SAM-dependent methyltransferase